MPSVRAQRSGLGACRRPAKVFAASRVRLVLCQSVLFLAWLLGSVSLMPSTAGADDGGGSSLQRVLNPSPFFTNIGSTTSQGVAVMKVDQARATFGVTGAGIRLGLISDSFNGSGSTPTVATQIAAGNLPGTGNPDGYTTPVTVLKDDTGTDEGRAMLEIVFDVAPAAELYFHSAFNNATIPDPVSNQDTVTPDQTIADAIDALSAVPGMRVIVDDVGILTAARFQDGAAAQSVDAAAAAGQTYFSSAGNSGRQATRVTTSATAGGTVNWGTDNLFQMRLAANSSGLFTLQWGEPYPSISGAAATSNFSIDITSPDGLTTFFTIDDHASGDDPYEFVQISNSGAEAADFAVRVNRITGSEPVVMQLSKYQSALTITDPDSTNAPTVFGHAAAEGGIATAAAAWFSPGTIESFSSRGPTLILFDDQGNPINETRQTPQLTGPDGVSTTTAGFSSFFGTSAASPHAAAVAALVLERFDAKGVSVTPQQLYRVMEDSAVEIAPAGFDNSAGYGMIDALAAVSAGRIWDGNGETVGVAGSGNWSDADWTLEASGDKPTGKFIRGQQAVFGSGAGAQTTYTVTVDGDYDVAGIRFARDTVTLANGGGSLLLSQPTLEVAAGLTATVAASLTGAGGMTKTGTGRLVLEATNTYQGPTAIESGILALDGSLASAVTTVSAGATLAGSGSTTGTVAGSGAIAPGNSPGILTVAAVDPSGGLDFRFEFGGVAPDYGDPANSINDVLRITDTVSPFVTPLGPANVIDVYFNDITSLGQFQGLTGTSYEGGFFTDSGLFDLQGAIAGGQFRYWIYGDGAGSSTVYNGVPYYSLRAFDPDWTRNFSVGSSGSGGGQVMSLTVIVPEPGGLALAAVAVAAAGFCPRVRVWARRTATRRS